MIMKILCVIPARLASTRLPRKPLQLLKGRPIIQHTLERALKCHAIDRVIVATDSEEIVRVVEAMGGEAVITDPKIRTGSDRVAEVARTLPEYEVVINLQADEPFISPQMLSMLVGVFQRDASIKMATMASLLKNDVVYQSPDKVKVVLDNRGNALYFSRASIPYYRTEKTFRHVFNHIGIYAYQRDFLNIYTQLPQTPLEQAELLEQLRALEHGYEIRVCPIEEETFEINTPEELAMAQTLF